MSRFGRDLNWMEDCLPHQLQMFLVWLSSETKRREKRDTCLSSLLLTVKMKPEMIP